MAKAKTTKPVEPKPEAPAGLQIAPEAARQKVNRHVALIASLVQGLSIYLMFAPEDVAEKIKGQLRSVIAALQTIVGDDEV